MELALTLTFFLSDLFLIFKVTHEFLSLSCQTFSDGFPEVPASWWSGFPWSSLTPVTCPKLVTSLSSLATSPVFATWEPEVPASSLLPSLLPEWSREGCIQIEVKLGCKSTHRYNLCSDLLVLGHHRVVKCTCFGDGQNWLNPNCHLQVIWLWAHYLVNLGLRFLIC